MIIFVFLYFISLLGGSEGGRPSSVLPDIVNIRNKETDEHICTGVLISTNVVISCASCFVVYKPWEVLVEIEGVNSSTGGVKSWHKHFKAGLTQGMFWKNDLIAMRTEVKFSKGPARIPNGGIIPKILKNPRYYNCREWTYDDEFKTFREIFVDLLNSNACHDYICPGRAFCSFRAEDPHLCSKNMSKINKRLCTSYGGPLECKGFAIGLRCFSKNCGSEFVTVYTIFDLEFLKYHLKSAAVLTSTSHIVHYIIMLLVLTHKQ